MRAVDPGAPVATNGRCARRGSGRASPARALPALVLCAALGDASLAGACPAVPRVFESASFRAVPDVSYPGGSPAGERVSLPDAWGRSRPGVGGLGAYRFVFRDADPSNGPCALYLPQVNANAVAYVNGSWIGQGGSMEEPVAHNFNRPLLIEFSPALLHPGENVVDVVVRGYADGAARLGPVRLGPAALLAPQRDADFARSAGLAQAGTALALISVLMVSVLWVAMGFDPAYGWFLVAAGTWTFASLNDWWRDVPFDHWAWERLMNGALDQTPVLLLLWLQRFLAIGSARSRRLLWFASAGFAALAAFTPRALWPQVVLASHSASLAMGALVAVLLLRHVGRMHRPERVLYSLGAVTAVGLSAHDFAFYLRGDAPPAPLMPVALSLAVGAFGVTQLLHFARSTREIETLNSALEKRVAAREAELEHHYARVRALERQEILAAERDRMTRELHDGLGGRIVSALALAEREPGGARIAEVLRDSLAEMRMVLDSLDPDLADLPSLLAHVRDRLEPVLEGTGLRLRWEVADLSETARWGPERLLNVLRIVQEALTNAVRHADASQIVVRARTVGAGDPPAAVEIAIEDDGVGIDAARAGRGLGHMRQRAALLGGVLRVERRAPGTTVAVTVPGGPTAARA